MHGHRLQAPRGGSRPSRPTLGCRSCSRLRRTEAFHISPDPRSGSTEAWLQGQPQEQPCPFPSFRSLLHLALGCHVAISAPLPDSELPEAGCVAPGAPSGPCVQTKGRQGPSCVGPLRQACFRGPSVCSAGRETLSWAPEGPCVQCTGLLVSAPSGNFSCPSCSWWLRAGATVGLGLGPAGVALNTRGLATIIRVRTMQRATCSKILYSSVMTVVLTNQRPREINKPACTLPMKLAHTVMP